MKLSTGEQRYAERSVRVRLHSLVLNCSLSLFWYLNAMFSRWRTQTCINTLYFVEQNALIKRRRIFYWVMSCVCDYSVCTHDSA